MEEIYFKMEEIYFKMEEIYFLVYIFNLIYFNLYEAFLFFSVYFFNLKK